MSAELQKECCEAMGQVADAQWNAAIDKAIETLESYATELDHEGRWPEDYEQHEALKRLRALAVLPNQFGYEVERYRGEMQELRTVATFVLARDADLEKASQMARRWIQRREGTPSVSEDVAPLGASVKLNSGGETMRATGEKPDPAEGTACVAGDRSNDQDHSKRAAVTGLGQTAEGPKASSPPLCSSEALPLKGIPIAKDDRLRIDSGPNKGRVGVVRGYDLETVRLQVGDAEIIESKSNVTHDASDAAVGQAYLRGLEHGRAANRTNEAQAVSDDVLDARMFVLDEALHWLADNGHKAAADALYERDRIWLLEQRPDNALSLPPGVTVRDIAGALALCRSEEAMRFVLQILGLAACPKCDFIKSACKCSETALPKEGATDK